MTISDSTKVDFLWKKVIYGTTATSTTKDATNEAISSALVVDPNNIWGQASTIPGTPPLSTTSVVEVRTASARIKMTADPLTQNNEAWLATSTYGVTSSRLVDFITPLYGTGYLVQVYIGDPNVGPAARIFPGTPGEEYVFDYAAGVLNFVNNVPANKTASIGSGTVSVASNGIYIQAYRYVGTKGSGGGSGSFVSKSGDTMSGRLSFGTYVDPQTQTILLYNDPAVNSVVGLGHIPNSQTRFFTDSTSALSFGHVSEVDGSYQEDLSIDPSGVLTVGGAGDGYLTTQQGNRIVIGHTNAGVVTENLTIEANNAVMINGYIAYHTGNLNLQGLGLVNSGVTPGTYQYPTLDVDQYGRITNAVSGSASGTGTVTSVDLHGSNSISATGGPITGAGIFSIDLTDTGVSPGLYTKVQVDSKGRVINSGTLSSADVTGALGYTPLQTVSNANVVTALGYQPLQHNETITVAGPDITSNTGSTSLFIDLTATGVSAGTYTYATLVVDSKGRVRAANTGATPISSFTITTDNSLKVNGSNTLTVSNSTTVVMGLSTTGVTPAIYTLAQVGVDAQGRITFIANGTGGSGTVQSVNLTSPANTLVVTGGPVTSIGTFNVDLSNSGVTPGTYAKVVVDRYGRVTANASLASADVTGALGFTPLQHNETITLSGDATGTGTNAITVTLATVGGLVPGAYSLANVTVDAKGRVIAISNGTGVAAGVTTFNTRSGAVTLSNTDVNTALGYTPLQHNEVISLSGDASGSGTNAIAVTLANIPGLTAGTYTVATVAVDSKGRVVAISNGTASGTGTVTSVNITNTTEITATGGPVTGAGAFSLNLAPTGVAAGTYSKVIVDTKGRVTGNSALSNTDVTTALGYTPLQTVTNSAVVSALGYQPLQHNEVISLSGDASGSGSSAITVTLANAGSPGTYTKVTTDAKGRVVSGSALANTDVTGALGFTPLQHNEVITVTGDVTGSGSNALALTLANVGTAGTYTKVTTDAQGRVISGGALSNTDVTTALGYTPLQTVTNSAVVSALGYQPLQHNETITLSGDVTGSGSNALSVSLANVVGLTPGTYSSANIVVDSKGRVTQAANGTGGGGGGSVDVSYGNASVVSSASLLNFIGNGVQVASGGLGTAEITVPDRVEYVMLYYTAGSSGDLSAVDAVTSTSPNCNCVVTSGTGTIFKVTFTGYQYPPTSIAYLGQNYSNNTYSYTIPTSGQTRVVDAGGGGPTSALPSFLGNFSDMSITLPLSATGAVATPGQRTRVMVLFKF